MDRKKTEGRSRAPRAAQTSKFGFRSVFVDLPKPKKHKSCGNLDGLPLVSIEVMHGWHEDGEEDLVFWAHGRGIAKKGIMKGDVEDESESFVSLCNLCKEYDIDIDEAIALMSAALVKAAGKTV